MLLVYLDQNHLIDLARAESGSPRDPAARQVRDLLLAGVKSSKVLCPLSRVHIIETSRIGDHDKRLHLARLLVALSDGWMLAGRSTRLTVEFELAVAKLFGEDVRAPVAPWPLVGNLVEAYGSIEYLSEKTGIPASTLSTVSALDSRQQILSFLEFPFDAERRLGVENYSHGADELTSRIEGRRAEWRGKSYDMRLRAYSAIVLIECKADLDRGLRRWGKTFDDLMSLGDERCAGLIEMVPTLNVERLLAIQVEQQFQRTVSPNDANDVDALCAAIPYCDFVVTERMWAALARQSRVTDPYRAEVLGSLSELSARLEPLL